MHKVCTSLMHKNWNSSPSSLSCVLNWPSTLASEGCVHSLKFCNTRQPGKAETVSPSSDTHVTLVAVPRCQLNSIPHVLKHSDPLVLKIIRLWEAVCITLYSQNPNTTFKIRFSIFPHGLWRARSTEHRVMKKGWKYPHPLKHQEGRANWQPCLLQAYERPLAVLDSPQKGP